MDGLAEIQFPGSAGCCGAIGDGLGALAVNSFCAILLARYRAHGGSLTRAAFLSARNDALANVGIIAAGLATAQRSRHGPM